MSDDPLGDAIATAVALAIFDAWTAEPDPDTVGLDAYVLALLYPYRYDFTYTAA